jgi:signal transduction histidine kinase
MRLHDSVCQSLAVARLNLQLLARSITDCALAKKLSDVSTEIRVIMEESYSLMLELSSPVLYELGLTAALGSLLESRLLDGQGVEYELVAPETRLDLDREMQVTLYQAVRELLVNAVKYAEAGKVEVAIEKEGDCLRISVKDDGIGFDESAVKSPSGKGGFGLFNLTESLEGLGGKLKIESRPGQGTVATITAPLVCESKA